MSVAASNSESPKHAYGELVVALRLEIDREMTGADAGTVVPSPQRRSKFAEEETARGIMAVLEQNLRLGVISQEEYQHMARVNSATLPAAPAEGEAAAAAIPRCRRGRSRPAPGPTATTRCCCSAVSTGCACRGRTSRSRSSAPT